jgi:3-oxoacyl-[acyl-carrier-protein] synthase II
MGVISPIGSGRHGFSLGLQEGRSGVGRITRFDARQFPSQLAAEVKDFDPTQYLSPKKIRQMDRCTQFGVATAIQAVTDAGLDFEKLDCERVGVLIGTAVGGLRWAFEQERTQQDGGYKSMNPYSMIATYPNAVSGQVAVEFGLKGRADTISSGCASAGTAFGSAAELIQRGELDVVLVGGTEAPLDATIFGAMCSAGALSTLNDEPFRTPRPFDAERDGPVLGEGAGVLVFEDWEHALERGAQIYAEFKGWGSTCDAYSLTRTDPSGQQATRAVQMALRDAALVPSDIDYINAYAIATHACDWTEARVIKAMFGTRASQIPVSGIQSMTGYPWAALGAFQLISNCLAIADGVLAPTINFAVRDPNCDLDIVPNHARHAHINTALSNLFGCGKNVAIIVQRALV